MRRLLLVELIKVDLEYRWGQGLQKRIAEYVAEFPELAEEGCRSSCCTRSITPGKNAGLHVDLQEYADEYPEHAETLRQWLGVGRRGVSVDRHREAGTSRTPWAACSRARRSTTSI